MTQIHEPSTTSNITAVTADSAAELNDLPVLHRMTDDTVDLLCQAEHISFHNTSTFLLQQQYQTGNQQSETDIKNKTMTTAN